MSANDPEFPVPEEDFAEADVSAEDEAGANAGDGLVEPAGVPFDEEIERVVQPEPVGD